MERAQIDQLQQQMSEIIKKLAFKGKANQLRDLAIDAMKQSLHDYDQMVGDYKNQIYKLNNEKSDLDRKLYYQSDRNSSLEQKLKVVIENANLERKNAAQRGNRFKRQYDKILDNVDAVLPGAKLLLLKKGSSERDQQSRIAKLNRLIEQQREKVNELVADSYKYGHTLLEGYGRERRILRAMIARKNREEKRVTYSD